MHNNTRQPDLTVEDQGTVVLFEMNTHEGYTWVKDHVVVESWQTMGKHRFAVDPRFALEIMFAALNDGLSVET